MLQPWMIPADLAPGDAKSATGDWSGFELHDIRSIDDPMFRMAFDALWEEFGAKNELETADVLAQRMRWDPSRLVNGCSLLYQLLLVTRDGAFVGVRDHTAIVRPDFDAAVVHMSHNLVAPDARRSGIAGWLRALPVQTARACLAAQRRTGPIILVAEMEPLDATDVARTIRLTAYEKAGYRMIDPSVVSFLQPDFRPAQEIDATGGPRPLRLNLLVRIVGEESRESLKGATVRGIATSLYCMYGAGFREKDMQPVWENLERFPGNGKTVRLIAPTAAS